MMKAKVNDILINYEIVGEGKPLIFLHGNGEDMQIFTKTVDFFKRNYMCVCIDSRGHGKSEQSNLPLTTVQMADDIIKLIKHLNLADITLIGFSDGGNIALEIAAQIRIENLVIVGANLFPKGMKFWIRVQIALLEALCLPLYPFKRIRGTLFRLRIMSRQPHITEQKLAQINARTLILAGENDMIKHRHTLLIHSLIARSQLYIFNNAGHFLFKNNSNEMNAVLQAFLTKE